MMTEYTLIPAAPGTVMIEASVAKRPGQAVEIDEYAIIAWRVPTAPSTASSPLAVLLGGLDVPFDIPSAEDVRDEGHSLSMKGFQVAGGPVASRFRSMSRPAFETFMAEQLTKHLDQHFAELPRREPVDLRQYRDRTAAEDER